MLLEASVFDPARRVRVPLGALEWTEACAGMT
jgi:hypothetical protein